MESFNDFLTLHWDHELSQSEGAPQERAADVSSADPSVFCRQDAGSTLKFMESLQDSSTAHRDHEPRAKRIGARASWTAATESSESPLWDEVAASAASFRMLSAATAKAVTSRTPSPQSKTWRLIRRFMEVVDY